MSEVGQSRPVRASNGSVDARYALKADVKSTDLCRLMVPRCTLYKLPKGSLVLELTDYEWATRERAARLATRRQNREERNRRGS